MRYRFFGCLPNMFDSSEMKVPLARPRPTTPCSASPNVKALETMGKMMSEDDGWSVEIATLQMPTLLVFGDNASISQKHMVQFFALPGRRREGAGRPHGKTDPIAGSGGLAGPTTRSLFMTARKSAPDCSDRLRKRPACVARPVVALS
jgi:hypothetical protein